MPRPTPPQAETTTPPKYPKPRPTEAPIKTPNPKAETVTILAPPPSSAATSSRRPSQTPQDRQPHNPKAETVNTRQDRTTTRPTPQLLHREPNAVFPSTARPRPRPPPRA
uniref:Uncharacterized protein n=1 Tax=Fagus sylvatica TaxID=28930 RepID=A0A2N9J6R0_FAGSY